MKSLVVAGVAAGAFVSLADVLPLAVRNQESATLAAVFAIDLFAGTSAAICCGLLVGFSALLQGLGKKRINAFAADAILIAAAAIPLGIALFSGRAIRRTVWGQIGPCALVLFAFLCAYASSVLLRASSRYLSEKSFWFRLIPFGFFSGLAAALIVIDRSFYLGLYGYLHVLLGFGALTSMTLAFHFLRLLGALRPFYAAVLVVAIMILGGSTMTVFPATNSQRLLLAREPLLASRAHDLAIWLRGTGREPLAGSRELADRLKRMRCALNADKAREISGAARRRPTLLVVVDALRIDRVGAPALANLNRLKEESIFFTRAYAPSSSTFFSLPAISAGMMEPKADVPTFGDRLPGRAKVFITVDRLVDYFKGSDPRQFYRDYPFLRGFDRIETVKSESGGAEVFTADKITDLVVSLLSRDDCPDLIWAQYYDLHQWLSLKEDWLRGKGSEGYDLILRRIDEQLGRLYEYRNRVNMVLLADHGEGLGDHEVQFHSSYLYPELVHVPLLIRVPDIPSATVDIPVGLVDLMPTVFDMMGAPAVTGWEGRSLLGLVGASNGDECPPILLLETNHWSLIHGRWRLLFDPYQQTIELFDIKADPNESTNLAETASGQAAVMLEKLFAILADRKAGKAR